jgi:hypothetical protein
MVALHEGLGDRFPGYPVDRGFPDGRITQQETA